MKKLKASNKNGQNVIKMYARMNATCLDELYKSYSFRKLQAFRDCKAWCDEDNGYEFRVGNANSFGFSCGWFYCEDNTEYLRVETPKTSYIVNMEM